MQQPDVKVGDRWYVQFKGSKVILVRNVTAIDETSVTLVDPQSMKSAPLRVERRSLTFVSKHNARPT